MRGKKLKSITISGKTLRNGLAVAVASVLLAVAAGCGSSSGNDTPQAEGQKLTQDAYARVVDNPANKDNQYPKIDHSTELTNLHERLLRYNDPNKISYIYLLSAQGGIYAYFTIKGKVTSNGSQMTTTQAITWKCDKNAGSWYCDHVVTDLPEDDLSYGPSEPGIFFFTTDNVMVTWDGPYLLTDAPMKIDPAKVTLTYIDGSKPTSVGGK